MSQSEWGYLLVAVIVIFGFILALNFHWSRAQMDRRQKIRNKRARRAAKATEPPKF